MNEPERRESCTDSNITQINKNIVNGVHYPSEFAARLARDALEAAERYYNLFFQTHPTSTCTCANTHNNNTDKNGDMRETEAIQDEITKQITTTSNENINTSKHAKGHMPHLQTLKEYEDEENKEYEEEEDLEEEEWKHVKKIQTVEREQNVETRATPTVKEKMKLNDLTTNTENEIHSNELIARFVTPPPPPSLPSPLSSSLSRSMRAFDAATATRTPKRSYSFELQQEHEKKEYLKEEEHEKRTNSVQLINSTKQSSLLTTTVFTPEKENKEGKQEITETHHLLEEEQNKNEKSVKKTNKDNSNNMKDARKMYQNNLGNTYNIDIEKSPTQYSASSMIHTPLNVENTQYHTFFPPVLSHRRREEIIREILGHAPCSYERWQWKRAFDFHHLHINIERSNSLYQPHHHPLLTHEVKHNMTEEPQKELQMLEFHHSQSNNSEKRENTTINNNNTITTYNRVDESSANSVNNTSSNNKKKQFPQLSSLFNSRSTSVELRRNSPIAPRHSLLGPRQSPVSAEPPQHTFPLPLSHRGKHDVLVHDSTSNSNNIQRKSSFNGKGMPNALNSFTKTSAAPSSEVESKVSNNIKKTITESDNINAKEKKEEEEKQEHSVKENTTSNNNDNKKDEEDASFYTFPTSRQGPEYFHATAEDGTKTLIIIMVGLPARGKTFLAQKICRLLNWHGSRAKVHNLQVMWRRLLLNEMNETHGLLSLEEECSEEETESHRIHDETKKSVEQGKCNEEKTVHDEKTGKHNKHLHTHITEHPTEKSSLTTMEEESNVKHKCKTANASRENVNCVGVIPHSNNSISSSRQTSHIDIEHSTISSAPSNYVCTKHFEDLILHSESTSRLLYLHVLESVAEDCRQFFLHGGEVVVINDDFVSENLRLAAEELLKPLATQLIYMEVMRDATDNAHFDVLKVQDPSEYPPSSVAAMHAMSDFKARVKFLESVYEPLGLTNMNKSKNRKCCVLPTHSIEVNSHNDRSYIRVLNPDIVEAHGIRGYAASRIISYVMNLSQSKIQHPIYFLRHGESCYNPEDRIGGDPLLTEQGMRDAAALLEFLYSLKKHLRHVSKSQKSHTLKCLQHNKKEQLQVEQQHSKKKDDDDDDDDVHTDKSALCGVHGHENCTINDSSNNNNNNNSSSSEELEI